MTNGEMIQKVFNCEVCEPIIEDDIIHVIFADKKDSAIGFDWSWWNAEYKESTTRNCFGCKYSKDNYNSDTEECHLCMWENQYTPTTKNDLEVDAVSRQAVLYLIADDDLSMGQVVKGIHALPSVTPQEPRKGHWIVAKGGSYLGMRNACCSNCKDFYTNDWNVMNYCPNCGSDNREVEE